jgi:transcriptional regulator with XRE-family HTH domain
MTIGRRKMLLEKLKAIQKTEGVSDSIFAGKLGISQQLWNAYRNHVAPIPKPLILTGVLKAYPGLVKDVLLFLCSDGDILPQLNDALSNPHQPHQGNQQGSWFKKVIKKVRRAFQ